MSRALGPATLGAHTITSGSAERSICFLSSIDVQGYGLVAQLRKLYPHFGRRDVVRPAPDYRPRTPGRRHGPGHPGNFWPVRKHLFHQGRQIPEGVQDLVRSGRAATAGG